MWTKLRLIFLVCALGAWVPTARSQTGSLEPSVTMGDGSAPVILIPGLACDWTVWRAFMERHTDQYTMRAVTLPGFAGTPPPPSTEMNSTTPWIDHAVRSVAAMIETEQLDRPIIIGHSLGGVVAYRLAIDRPDLVRAVIAVDSPPAIPLGDQRLAPDERVRLVDEIMRPALESQSDEAWFAQQRAAIEAMVESETRASELVAMAARTPRAIAVQYTLELFATDLRAALETLDTPILAIAAIPGATDNADAMRQIWAEQLAPALSARVRIIEDARHFVMDDQPEVFDEAVSGFIETLTLDASAPPPTPARTPR